MQPLLEINNLKLYYSNQRLPIFSKKKHIVKAVDDVSIKIYKGETLGLVGESGSGKTSFGRAILRIVEPANGKILFYSNNNIIDITKLEKNELKDAWKQMQMIFQDPYSSLNPRMTIKEIISEPLIVNKLGDKNEIDKRVIDIVEKCGLDMEQLSRYPHAFSGGQRQRIGIARALVLNPEFIVCDEPVSSLDVSIQAQIMNLLKDLQNQFDLTYLFIAHDLSVVAYICDRVVVMYLGKFVEIGPVEKVYYTPKHPYTEALMSAIPAPDPENKMRPILLSGEKPNPANPPKGCRFHTRCRYATNKCKEDEPKLVEYEPDHFVACHYADKLQLKGALQQ